MLVNVGGKSMKIIANNYEPKDVMRIMREWSSEKQADFGKSIDLSGLTFSIDFLSLLSARSR